MNLYPLTPQEEELFARRWAESVGGNDAKQLIAQGCKPTYAALFGQSFVDGLAPHHLEAIEWHWESRIAFLEDRYPEFDAYFPIWSRAHNKSGVARRIAVVDGFLSFAYGQPAFILYLSRNKAMVAKHAKSIETLLQSPRVKKYCPELSEVQTNDKNKTKGWTQAFLYTKANVIFQFSGLDEGLAGGNLETNVNENSSNEVQSDVRITLFVPDDIDGREDSPVIAETRFNTLTGEVLPMGQENSLVFFAQNLISRYSTMYRIYKQQARVLTGRKPTKPIKAVENLKVEQRTTEGGLIQDIYVSGEPTWHIWDARRIQSEINRFGYPAFLKECQHEVDQDKTGRVHKRYDDNVHPISYSQHTAIYGHNAWKDWYKVVFSDWARTKSKKHANVAGYLCVSSQNTKYPGMTFLIPFSFAADTSPEDVAERLLSTLTPYAYRTATASVTWKQLIDDAWKRANAEQHFESVSERLQYLTGYYQKTIPQYASKVLAAYKVRAAVNSHSEDKVREMFNRGFGFGFKPANPTKTEALDEIDAAMKVDYGLDHIFDKSKKGYTRWYVLCKDDLNQEPELIDGVLVYPPAPYPEALSPNDLHDDDLFRYQMIERRFAPPKLQELGERIDELEKSDDDYGQGLQFVYSKDLLSNITYTEQEKINLLIPQEVQEIIKSPTKQGVEPVIAALRYGFHKDLALQALYPERDEDLYE